MPRLHKIYLVGYPSSESQRKNEPCRAIKGPVKIPLYSRSMRTSWTMPLGVAEEPSLILFCFPFAGGGATAYSHWIGRFPANLQVIGVQLPGRGERINEAPFRTIPALADAFIEATQLMMQQPFGFFGHSMGAILAYEIASRLRSLMRSAPQFLIASACIAPHVRLNIPARSALSEEDLIEELRALNGTPSNVLTHRELLEIALPAIRADFAAIETYRCSNIDPLDCPILAITGTDDHRVELDKQQAWRHLTHANFTHCVLPGDHFSVLSRPEPMITTLRKYIRNFSETNDPAGTQISDDFPNRV